ncbi:unnamed protein product [Arabidopsis thaliana]|uniref:F-box domain-containing protein n=1 Tax=Arabidopsis thaliana TaxID=3702 RepID=A0A654FDQ2_ARATH|nr:unnamed protein product [Arabidopsis thaliana]
MNAYLSLKARGRQILIDTVDQISKLPDNVLVMILKEMLTEDAVKTSVLSKRWKTVWKQVPYVLFDMQKSFLTIMEPLPTHSNRVAKLITEDVSVNMKTLDNSRQTTISDYKSMVDKTTGKTL